MAQGLRKWPKPWSLNSSENSPGRNSERAPSKGWWSAGDPYTVWIPPRDRVEFVKEVQGTFAGIGVSVSSDPRGALVRTPLDDSPALEAGVQAGDLIVAVGDEDLTGMALPDIIALVAGPEGSSVDITVLRDEQEQTFTVVRRQIGTQTVLGLRRTDGQWQWQLEDGVLVVRIDQFWTRPRVIFARLLKTTLKPPHWIRTSEQPRGSLSAAVETCDLFLDGGGGRDSQPPGSGSDL